MPWLVLVGHVEVGGQGEDLVRLSLLVDQVILDRGWQVEVIDLSLSDPLLVDALPDDSTTKIRQGQWLG